jgi:hypothetical protein
MQCRIVILDGNMKEYPQLVLASLLSVAEGVNVDGTRSYCKKRLI